MPKKKHRSGRGASGGAGSRRKGRDRATARRERKGGLYLSPGDADYKQLAEQLRREGLALKDVPGDGNCLFRAFAEQLQDHHGNLRHAVVQHMRANSADYAPFIDDETSFDSYMDELSKDGTYAGNDVIVALSRCYGLHVVIHQLDIPHWEVQAPLTPGGQGDKTVHVAYLRGEHYCSVRPLYPGHTLPPLESVGRDVPSYPAASVATSSSSSTLPISSSSHLSQEDCSSTSLSPPCSPTCFQTPPTSSTSGSLTGHPSMTDPLTDPLSVAVHELLEASGCEDHALAEQILTEAGGAVDLALVELLQIMSLSDPSDTAQVLVGGGGGCSGGQRQLGETSTSLVTESNTRHLDCLSKGEKKEAKRQRKAAERRGERTELVEKDRVAAKLI